MCRDHEADTGVDKPCTISSFRLLSSTRGEEAQGRVCFSKPMQSEERQCGEKRHLQTQCSVASLHRGSWAARWHCRRRGSKSLSATLVPCWLWVSGKSSWQEVVDL